MYVQELKFWMDKIRLHDLLESHFVKYSCGTEYHSQIPGTRRLPSTAVLDNTRQERESLKVCNGLRGILSTFKDAGVVYH